MRTAQSHLSHTFATAYMQVLGISEQNCTLALVKFHLFCAVSYPRRNCVSSVFTARNSLAELHHIFVRYPCEKMATI